MMIGALLASAAAYAQSLGDVARREKERRARARDSRGTSSPVIADPAQGRGDNGRRSVPSTASSPDEDAERNADPAEATSGTLHRSSGGNRLSDAEARELRERWRVLWESQLEQAEQGLKKARDDVYQCDAASRYFFVPLSVDCGEVDERLALAERQLAEVKARRYQWEHLLPDGPRGPPTSFPRGR